MESHNLIDVFGGICVTIVSIWFSEKSARRGMQSFPHLTQFQGRLARFGWNTKEDKMAGDRQI